MKLSKKNRFYVKLHHILSKWPFGFKLAKTLLSKTFIHKSVQNAIHQQRSTNISQAIFSSDNLATTENTSHWDNHVALVESKILKGWLDWEFIEVEHIRPSVSGDRSIYYLQHFFSGHLPTMPVKRSLSLGCGGGNLERALLDLNASEFIDAFDASPESINLANQLASESGYSNRLTYNVADINKIQLVPNSYDFIVAKMSLHHFEDFDHIFNQISIALKPGGVFMFNEYVGPTRFQWTDLQLSIANRILKTLPERYRFSSFTGTTLDKIGKPTIQEMIDMDPSEAINSAEIIPKVKEYFEIVELKKYGGTILHLLMNHIMANFDTENELDATILKLIFLQEQVLVENQILNSDFCYAVMKPKGR